MRTLLVFFETITDGYIDISLNYLSLLSIICGIFVIITKNPIVSVLFLIGLFLNIAFYLIILGISFIGLSYLLVYVGAVSILFLFILMLINVRISELLSDTSNSIVLAVIISICFYYSIYEILPYNFIFFNYNITLNNLFYDYYDHINNYFKLFNYYNNNDIMFVLANIWDGNLVETTQITTIGNIMYTNYSFWLIITSIILLLAMVGAIIITIKQN